MKRIACFLFSTMIISALTACGPAPAAPTSTATDSPMPTATYTPSPTATYTPVPPLDGRLFFDMNGSGLQDEAIFNYDPARLADPRQPLQPDLDKSIDAYVSAHPDLKNGDLITIEEPGLSSYTVCVKSDCVQTDAEGNFSLPNPSGTSRVSIKITDPNADNPSLAMRYINDWKGPVVVPAYTKDVDAATMAKLTTIPGCDADLVARVCKLDEDTLQVRDQHLNDTSIIPIGDGMTIVAGKQNEVGLMLGFLTLPFVQEQVPEPFIWNYFDILSVNLWPSNYTVNDVRNGIVLNYNGEYNQPLNIQQLQRLIAGDLIAGIDDGHPGLDYRVDVGNFIISTLPTSTVLY
ncbi:MAG: hypothetical protein KJ939_07535, partial [Nanoarchaeota archaeon]|nr:hypothetical protein [Nanoarchaeota archaeon]